MNRARSTRPVPRRRPPSGTARRRTRWRSTWTTGNSTSIDDARDPATIPYGTPLTIVRASTPDSAARAEDAFVLDNGAVLRGTVLRVAALPPSGGSLVLEVGGIGYAVNVTAAHDGLIVRLPELQ